MVEPQPSKLMVRVRSPSPAPLERAGAESCNARFESFAAHVAQSVEHLLGKEEVDGSIPFVSTTTRRASDTRSNSRQSNRSETYSHGKG